MLSSSHSGAQYVPYEQSTYTQQRILVCLRILWDAKRARGSAIKPNNVLLVCGHTQAYVTLGTYNIMEGKGDEKEAVRLCTCDMA